MQRPFPAQATAALTFIPSLRHHGRHLPHHAQPTVETIGSRGAGAHGDPDLIWLTDPGSTIEMALTTRRLHPCDRETLVVVVVAGEIDAASAPRLSAFIDGVYFPHETVRLDLGSTAFASGALLCVLETERALRAPHGAGVEIIRASPAIHLVLEAAGLLHYLSAM